MPIHQTLQMTVILRSDKQTTSHYSHDSIVSVQLKCRHVPWPSSRRDSHECTWDLVQWSACLCPSLGAGRCSPWTSRPSRSTEHTSGSTCHISWFPVMPADQLQILHDAVMLTLTLGLNCNMTIIVLLLSFCVQSYKQICHSTFANFMSKTTLQYLANSATTKIAESAVGSYPEHL